MDFTCGCPFICTINVLMFRPESYTDDLELAEGLTEGKQPQEYFPAVLFQEGKGVVGWGGGRMLCNV